MIFKESHSSRFFDALPKPEIGLPNWNFKEFFCCKRLIYSEKHVSRLLFIAFKENRQRCFSDIDIRSHFRSTLPHIWFSDFHRNFEILSMHLFSAVYKIWCSYFYKIWIYKAPNIRFTVSYTHTYTHTHRPICKNNFCGLTGPQNI